MTGINLSDLVFVLLNFAAVFFGVLLAFFLAERAKRTERLIERAVTPLHERAKVILQSFNPDLLAEYSVSDARELEPMERRAHMPLAPAIFFEPSDLTEQTYFIRACEKWPALDKWNALKEDAKTAYLSIFRAQRRLRRVLASFESRCNFPDPLGGQDDLPVRIVKGEYSSLAIKNEVGVQHNLFKIEVIHGAADRSDICFNDIPVLSCWTKDAQSIAEELSKQIEIHQIGKLVHGAHSAAKRIRTNADAVLQDTLSIIR